MKKVIVKYICSAALALCIPFAGCMQSKSRMKDDDLNTKTVQPEKDDCDDCPNDGDCPDDKCPDGDCPDDECPDDKCPPAPHGRVPRKRRDKIIPQPREPITNK